MQPGTLLQPPQQTNTKSCAKMQLWGPWGAQVALTGPGISKWHKGNSCLGWLILWAGRGHSWAPSWTVTELPNQTGVYQRSCVATADSGSKYKEGTAPHGEKRQHGERPCGLLQSHVRTRRHQAAPFLDSKSARGTRAFSQPYSTHSKPHSLRQRNPWEGYKCPTCKN